MPSHLQAPPGPVPETIIEDVESTDGLSTSDNSMWLVSGPSIPPAVPTEVTPSLPLSPATLTSPILPYVPAPPALSPFSSAVPPVASAPTVVLPSAPPSFAPPPPPSSCNLFSGGGGGSYGPRRI